MPLNFQLRRPNHAIGEFIAHLTFFRPIGPALFVEVANELKHVAADLDLTAPLFMQNLMVSAGEVSVDQQRAVGYQRFSAETGEAIEVIQCTAEAIIYTSRDYTNWKDIKNTVSAIFLRLGRKYLEEVPAIKLVSVQYQNDFRGPIDANLRPMEVLATGSKWVSPIAYEAEDLWHSHTGRFIPITSSSRFLVNVNVNAQHISPPQEEPAMVVTVLIQSSVNYDVPGHPPLVVTADSLDAVIDVHLEQAHEREKQVLNEVISPSYIAIMGPNADGR